MLTFLRDHHRMLFERFMDIISARTLAHEPRDTHWWDKSDWSLWAEAVEDLDGIVLGNSSQLYDDMNPLYLNAVVKRK